MPRISLRASLLAVLLLLCQSGCGDDDPNRRLEATVSTEAEASPADVVPPEGDAGEAPAETTAPAVNAEPDLTATVESADERFPGSWQLDFFLTECQEEVVNAMDTIWRGCLTLEATEVEDEYEGLSGSVEDGGAGPGEGSVYVGLVGGLPGSYVKLHALMARPADADQYPNALRCEGEWCAVLGHGFEEDTDPIPHVDDLAVSITDTNRLYSTGVFTPDDIVYVLVDSEGAVIGAVDAQGQNKDNEVASYFA